MKTKVLLILTFIIISCLIFLIENEIFKHQPPSITSDEKKQNVNTVIFPQFIESTQYEPEITHKVQYGDSIVSIAKKYSVSFETIISINKLSNPDQLPENITLVIPQYDETIKKIILKYKYGNRTQTNSVIDDEIDRFLDVHTNYKILEKSIIYNKNQFACVEIKYENMKKKSYLYKYDNDWQVVGMEI